MTLETYFRLARWRTESRQDITSDQLLLWALAWACWTERNSPLRRKPITREERRAMIAWLGTND